MAVTFDQLIGQLEGKSRRRRQLSMSLPKALPHCHQGCSSASIIDALTDMGLWPVASLYAPPGRLSPATTSEKAWDYWEESIPIPKTLAERYQRHRGIERYIDSPVLRFHPRVVPSAETPELRRPIPAMLAMDSAPRRSKSRAS